MERIATLKVAVASGTTIVEFRKYRTAIEACYEINKPHLTEFATDAEELSARMSDCETVWDFGIQHAFWVRSQRYDYYLDPLMNQMTRPDHIGVLKIMAKLHPPLVEKWTLYKDHPPPREERTTKDDPDFYPKNYVKLAFSQVSKKCDELIARLRER